MMSPELEASTMARCHDCFTPWLVTAVIAIGTIEAGRHDQSFVVV
jgi:hypothetical protein